MPCNLRECGTSGARMCLLHRIMRIKGQGSAHANIIKSGYSVVVMKSLSNRKVQIKRLVRLRAVSCLQSCRCNLPDISEVDVQYFALAELLAMRHGPAAAKNLAY